MADLELESMRALVGALDPLDEATRARVLQWARDRYGVPSHSPERPKNTPPDPATGAPNTPDDSGEAAFADLADLFSRAGPGTEAEKVLVAGYWFQVVEGQSELESLPVNKALKDLGHGIGTINKAFSALMDQKPQLAIQLKKSGSSRQARKKYRLTREGLARVREMLAERGG